MAVGFLFPAIGSQKKPNPTHMNTQENLNDRDFSDARADANRPHPVTILSAAYLNAGLPLEAAAQAAIADYEDLFTETALCA